MGERPRLLVVDDEPDMLEFFERVFRREYVVVRAASVDEAIALLERDPFDVVLTDHRMPRRTGLELLARAAELRPGAARVLLTGYSDPGDAAAEAIAAAAHASITKPVDGDTLRQRVAQALADRRK